MPEDDPGLDVLARAHELLLGGGLLAQALELVADDLHRLDEVVRARADVQADLARVGVLAGERVDASRPARAPRARPGTAATRTARRRSRPARGRRSAARPALQADAAERDVDLLGVLAHEAHVAPGAAGAGSGAGAGSSAVAVAEGALASSTIASWSTEPAAAITTERHVAARVELGDHVDRRVADHRRAADDRAAERVVAEDGLAQHVEHRVLRVVLVHGDLLEHDLALGVDVLERRPPDHVGHHVEGRRQVLVEHPRVDRGARLVGAGVELGAHAVEELVDLGRSVAGRALEEQVLEEVRQAGLRLRLTARARATKKPSAAERTPSIFSVATRRPEAAR